jgi:hypothetical protein
VLIRFRKRKSTQVRPRWHASLSLQIVCGSRASTRRPEPGAHIVKCVISCRSWDNQLSCAIIETVSGPSKRLHERRSRAIDKQSRSIAPNKDGPTTSCLESGTLYECGQKRYTFARKKNKPSSDIIRKAAPHSDADLSQKLCNREVCDLDQQRGAFWANSSSRP